MKQFVKRNFAKESGFQPLLPLVCRDLLQEHTEVVVSIATNYLKYGIGSLLPPIVLQAYDVHF